MPEHKLQNPPQRLLTINAGLRLKQQLEDGCSLADSLLMT
jgi:hypothetical protein